MRIFSIRRNVFLHIIPCQIQIRNERPDAVLSTAHKNSTADFPGAAALHHDDLTWHHQHDDPYRVCPYLN